MVDENRLLPLLTVREVAQILHVHSNTVRRWSDQGMIRAYRITQRGDRRFHQEDIVHFLQEFNVIKDSSRSLAPRS
ncbi:MAG: helix-turn-helix domain-containing protein [Dehalococcoidales bacterium]|nr:helix-turn-helix domain-containing protein [Dehalococcoidales bacterium]